MAPEASMVPALETDSPIITTDPPVESAEDTSMEPELLADPPKRPDKSMVILPPAASPTSITASPERSAASPPGVMISPRF